MNNHPPSRPPPDVIPEAAFHDHYLTARGPALCDIAEDLHTRLEAKAPSQRRDAGERRRQVVNNLVANIANLLFSPEHQDADRLAVATSKRALTRYDKADYPQNLCASILEGLEELGVINKHPYRFKRQQTTIEPTQAFTSAMSASGASISDIGRYHGAEAIWLTARTGKASFAGEKVPKLLVDYKDTAMSHRYRAEVLEFNDFLNQQHLTFDGIQQAPSALRRMFLLRDAPLEGSRRGLLLADDPAQFDLNGRLNGGFWMNLPSQQRHRIALNGEPLVDLDFVSMFAQLAYLKAGVTVPRGDLYAVQGLENHRAGAKAGLLSLLSRTGPMQRLSAELKDKLPDDWTAKRLVSAMQAFHPAIAHLFGTDIGVELMFAESQILMAALLELKAHDISALPMHDGVMVPASKLEVAAWAMQRASRRVVDYSLPVAEKAILRPSS